MTAPLRITFVQAQDPRFADTQMFGIHFMPVWAYTLAAHLADCPDVEIDLFDDRMDAPGSVREADLFLFTGINQDHDAILATRTALATRFPEARFAIGGPITWSYERAGKLESLSAFDHVFIGDGEEALPRFVRDLRAGQPVARTIRALARFDLRHARPMHRPLLDRTIGRYYGGVLEVSRGCPFLCEFCDVRVLPDNNRTHVKDPGLIVSELDALYDRGVRQALLACDNFVGDLCWAEAVCDAIIAWQLRTGKALSLYTWLTINVARHPVLLQKLRLAGFDLVFIGVESFSRSSLLETAKVQNTALHLVESLRTIQSHGVIVVAGLIFGFDTDPDDLVDVTLTGIREAGLISGDPSLLTALPGTPLHERMRLAGRLRDVKVGLGGFKYQTNVRYLKPAARVRAEFRAFVRDFTRGAFQFARLRRLYEDVQRGPWVPAPTHGWADLRRLLAMTLRRRRTVALLALRLARLLGSPTRVWYVTRAFVETWRRSMPDRPLWFHFKFWLFNWSNALTKYASLSDADFDVGSVDETVTAARVLPLGYDGTAAAEVPLAKARAQSRLTARALREFLDARGAAVRPPSSDRWSS